MEKNDKIKAIVAAVLLVVAGLFIANALGLFGTGGPPPEVPQLSPEEEARVQQAEEELERRMREQRVEPSGS
ncbi:MAG: hypothetical protein EA378_09775 [Phycisphaerales bacterium]|nr:MAG: hypothetical protein EA378_09775 [Phycisphaerales bacterium]